MSKRRTRKATEAVSRYPMPPIPIPPSSARKAFLVALRWKIKWRRRFQGLAPFRIWLRTVGAAGILFAAVGLMQTFFLPSVFAFYAGSSILAVDVLVEKIGPYAKSAVLVLLITTICVFTSSVVLHKSPIDLSYIVNGTKLDLIVSNNSPADDYRDMDLTVIPAPNTSSVIGSFRELTPGTPCTVISSPLQATKYPEMIMATPTGYAMYLSAIRLRCESVPHQDMAEFELQLVKRVVLNGQNAVAPVTPTAAPQFTISFAGKFRSISVAGAFERER